MAIVPFSWDANPASQQIQGYKIYYGRNSLDYATEPGSPTDVGLVLSAQIDVGFNGTVYASLSAYNALGESNLSAEIFDIFGPPASARAFVGAG